MEQGRIKADIIWVLLVENRDVTITEIFRALDTRMTKAELRELKRDQFESAITSLQKENRIKITNNFMVTKI